MSSLDARRAALAAALVAFAPRPAAAQDPPPPMVPDVPPEPPREPPPAPDAPPKPDVPPPAPPTPGPLAPPGTQLEPPPAPFQPPEAPAAQDKRGATARTLRGHRFITPFLIDTPFVTTNVGVGVELGRQWSPSYPAGGAVPFAYDQALGVATQYLSFGFAINERVEVGFAASYTSFLGGDANSALLFGGKSAWDLKPGVRFRLYSSASTQLALHLYGDFGSSSWEQPVGVFTEIAAEASQIAMSSTRTSCLAAGDLACALTSTSFNATNAVTTPSSLYGGGATFSLAHAFNGTFGLQAALGLDAAYNPTTVYDPTSGGTTTVGNAAIAFHVGLAPSLDFGNVSVMAEYQLTVIDAPTVGSSVDAPSLLTLRNAFGLGVYYTGRSNLVVGALATATIDEVTTTFMDQMDPTTGAVAPSGEQPYLRVSGQVTARYFF